jgi:CRP-like cAMP-binding protein
MNTSTIFSNINKHILLTDEEKHFFKKLLVEEHHSKNSFLIKQNDPSNHIYFVNSGILRAFYLSADGKESTVMFAQKDWWITDMYCFLNEKPAMVSIQAIKKATILKLSKDSLNQLYKEIPQFNTFFRILMQNAYCREQLRMMHNLSLSAKDRYEQFISDYPQIGDNVTLKQIATYLGITPEFLSAIRSKKV